MMLSKSTLFSLPESLRTSLYTITIAPYCFGATRKKKSSNNLRIFSDTKPDIKIDKVLVLSKMSRYEFEKKCTPGMTEKELKTKLAQRGSNYDALLERHDIHKKHLDNLISSLEKRRISTKVVQRLEYKVENIHWADVVMSAGGDGTFLLAASKLTQHGKALIGFNTDPYSSEGVLCLPRKFTEASDQAVEMLLSGRFSWLHRQRIRTTILHGDQHPQPVDLENQQLLYPEYRFLEDVKELETHRTSGEEDGGGRTGYVLPFLALNEVFIGESISARVSYYELSVDGSPMIKQKSSGIIMSTGTGSTSWYFSGSRLSSQCVTNLLEIVSDEFGVKIDPADNPTINRIVEKFNTSLTFRPSSTHMAYVVKDPIRSATLIDFNPRGFAKQIKVRSRCWDACIVIDGSISYRFNDGAVVQMSIQPQDALLTVSPWFDDS